MAGSRPIATPWVRATIYGKGDMKEFSNDFWFVVTAGTLNAAIDGTAAGVAIYSAYSALMSAPLVDTVVLRGIYTEIADGTSVVGTDYYQQVNGLDTSTGIPEDVAVVVRKLTGLPGKPNRGRWYFTQQAFDQIDGSYLSPTGTASYQALASALNVPIVFAGTGGSVTIQPAHFNRVTQTLHAIVASPFVTLLGTRRRRRGPF